MCSFWSVPAAVSVVALAFYRADVSYVPTKLKYEISSFLLPLLTSLVVILVDAILMRHGSLMTGHLVLSSRLMTATILLAALEAILYACFIMHV